MTLKPADELALIREQLRDLKRRETELVCGIQRGELDLVGKTVRAEVKLSQEQVLETAALPASIREDSQYWRTKFTDDVVLHPVALAHQTRQIPGQTRGLADEIPPQVRNCIYRTHSNITQ